MGRRDKGRSFTVQEYPRLGLCGHTARLSLDGSLCGILNGPRRTKCRGGSQLIRHSHNLLLISPPKEQQQKQRERDTPATALWQNWRAQCNDTMAWHGGGVLGGRGLCPLPVEHGCIHHSSWPSSEFTTHPGSSCQPTSARCALSTMRVYAWLATRSLHGRYFPLLKEKREKVKRRATMSHSTQR